MNKKGKLFTTGFTLRAVAAVIIAVALPFIVYSPKSPIAIIAFALGGFLLTLGGLVK